MVKYSRRYNKINITQKRKKKKLVNKQKDFQHKSSKKIINFCLQNNIGKLIVGDIQTKKIIDKKNKKINGLSKSTANISRFKTFLEYKSKGVGLEFILVNEAYTSKINCLTGQIEFNSDLKNREFDFDGLKIDRDLNSSINILIKSGKCLTQEETKLLLLNKLSEINVN